MIYRLGDVVLRPPEKNDVEALYQMKNDPDIAVLLGGFATGYARSDIYEWIEYHGKQTDEVVWIIAVAEQHQCIGHVGLYKIDHRVRTAEFGIMIGDRNSWGKGIGRASTQAVLDYGFCELNLNRIYLYVLATNERAVELYHSLGFHEEGRLRQAQYKAGQYIDVLVMAMLREEYIDGTST